MLKEQLLKEAQEIEVSIELDSVFESVELSDDTKAIFSTVYEAAVKKAAAQLAESHITQIAESADAQVQTLVEEKTAAIEEKLEESVSTFADHVAKEWLAENKLAIDRGIKADLFESMFAGLKELVIEHNVQLPEESVDVVAEMEEELAEHQDISARLFESNTAQAKEILALKRTAAINEKTVGFTDTQKEKIASLIEGLDYSDTFGTKLNAIVEMVVKSSKDKDLVTENAINNNEGLNYKSELLNEGKDKDASEQHSAMAAYTSAARRIHQ